VSRMREIRPSGSEGGVGQSNAPSLPLSVAAWPPAQWFRIRIFCSRGSLTPVAAPNASPNVFLAWDRLLRSGFGSVSGGMWPGGQVWKPGPAYPATVAAWPPAQWFRIRIFCSRGLLTPVAAPHASPNVFLAWDRLLRSGFGSVT